LPWKIVMIVLATGLGAAAYALVAPLLLSLFYPEYPEIIPFSQLYAFTFVATTGHICSVALTAHKKLKELYAHTITSSIGQILLMVAGVVLWGLWGLVIARVASAAMFGAIGFLLVQRARA
jgi:O-antigen/teichoic acid export membrane protein